MDVAECVHYSRGDRVNVRRVDEVYAHAYDGCYILCVVDAV